MWERYKSMNKYTQEASTYLLVDFYEKVILIVCLRGKTTEPRAVL